MPLNRLCLEGIRASLTPVITRRSIVSTYCPGCGDSAQYYVVDGAATDHPPIQPINLDNRGDRWLANISLVIVFIVFRRRLTGICTC